MGELFDCMVAYTGQNSQFNTLARARTQAPRVHTDTAKRDSPNLKLRLYG